MTDPAPTTRPTRRVNALDRVRRLESDPNPSPAVSSKTPARTVIDTVVQAATAGDVAELALLRWQWRVDEQGERGTSIEQFTTDFASWWSARSESHLAFLASVESRPVGMAWLAIVDRIPGPGQLLRRAGSLQSVYVRSAERGRGIGARLVEAAVAAAAEHGLEYVSVHPSARSFSLYRRAGFTDTSGVLELDLVER